MLVWFLKESIKETYLNTMLIRNPASWSHPRIQLLATYSQPAAGRVALRVRSIASPSRPPMTLEGRYSIWKRFTFMRRALPMTRRRQRPQKLDTGAMLEDVAMMPLAPVVLDAAAAADNKAPAGIVTVGLGSETGFCAGFFQSLQNNGYPPAAAAGQNTPPI